MSRRAAVIEDFDDDTDLPLPPRLPNTGTRGPLLQQLDNDEESDSDDQQAGPASPSRQTPFPGSSSQDRGNVTDITPYKTWTCIYPIYLDAKRPYGTGQRRIARAKSLWWPLSKDIAEAASRLGLGTLHEVNKAHPRDWENPGRVRVQWKKNGKLVNPIVKNKKMLLEMISFQIQHTKPECIPKPPYTLSSATVPVSAPANPTSTSTNIKGKQPLTTKPNPATASPSVKPSPAAASVAPATQKGEEANTKRGRRLLPVPPEPLPPLENRISSYSPALSTGVLLETIKAGMNATEGTGLPGVPAPGGMAKGKRKVVRVRG
ncbi:signal recognition particle, SRP19 subunit [Coprinopsis marcescibilis]|uniref:Signal recognition particle, SRP19 subunit n=1 Tax=Coprinopsis marcescibilis TaxID=230819 RepID=A0A5C3KL56_COPMA|nr:signal recognition particle, SRP19 subunit [Coprinopsis marcescibilis]